MRKATAAITGIATSTLLVATLVPAAATDSPDSPRGEGRPAAADWPRPIEPGQAQFLIPAWTLRDGTHRTTVRVRYPSNDPPAIWDGQPVEIQVRVDGSWTQVGEAKQQPLSGVAGSRTRMTFTLPIDGKIRIRAKAYSTESSITTPARTLHVEPTAPEHNPTALRKTGSYCWDPVIARNPSRIAYGCPGFGEYEYDTWLYNAKTDKRSRLDTYTDYPDFANGANVALGETLVYFGEDLDTYRARRYDLNTGKSRWVAFKRNGKRARVAAYSSISANGKRIAYSSRTPGIAPKATKGWNVYAVRGNSRKSQYIGRGDGSEIAAFGRVVVWRDRNDRIRRHDLRTGRTTSITKVKGHRRDTPDVSAGGRYVIFSAKRGNRRVVRFYDAKTKKLRTVAAGTSPTISDNGRYVAYIGKGSRDLYVWDGATNSTELISVGPSGEGSNAKMDVPDISPNGRWIIAAVDGMTLGSGKVAPDNGRQYATNRIVLFDRTKG